MRKIIVLSAAFGLLGCATAPFDADSVDLATARLRAANDICFAKAGQKQFQTVRAFTDCLADGNKQFASDIHLKNMAYYDAYRLRMDTLGNEGDAGRVTPAQFGDRITAIESDFGHSLGAAYAAHREKVARQSAALMALGASMQAAGASMQQPIPASTVAPPIHCQSYQLGFTTQTDCH